MEFRYFFPNFGRPPSNARILVKLYSEMNFSKFWIKNATRNLPSENYFLKNHFLKIPFYPSNYFFPQLGNWSNPKRIFTIGRFLHQKPWNFGDWGCVLYRAGVSPGMRASPSTCRVLTISWQVRGMCHSAAVFGKHVFCASVRVWSLPGGLFPFQHRRRSIVFRVLFQRTNKQTKWKPTNIGKTARLRGMKTGRTRWWILAEGRLRKVLAL